MTSICPDEYGRRLNVKLFYFRDILQRNAVKKSGLKMIANNGNKMRHKLLPFASIFATLVRAKTHIDRMQTGFIVQLNEFESISED